MIYYILIIKKKHLRIALLINYLIIYYSNNWAIEVTQEVNVENKFIEITKFFNTSPTLTDQFPRQVPLLGTYLWRCRTVKCRTCAGLPSSRRSSARSWRQSPLSSLLLDPEDGFLAKRVVEVLSCENFQFTVWTDRGSENWLRARG